jgi:RHS repeat-associated protein
MSIYHLKKNRYTTRIFLAVSTALCSSLAAPAWAQSTNDAPIRDEVGTDLSTGLYVVDFPTISLGPDGAGLSYPQQLRSDLFIGQNDTCILSVSGATVTIYFDTLEYKFSQSGSIFTSTSADGATLVANGAGYIFTDPQGERADVAGANRVCAQRKRPDGKTLTYSGSATTSNYGYQKTYSGTLPGTKILKIVNLAVDYCDTTGTCPSPTQNWPTITDTLAITGNTTIGFTYTYTATDQIGRQTKVVQSLRDQSGLMNASSITRPGLSGSDTVGFSNGRVANATISGDLTTYSWTDFGSTLQSTASGIPAWGFKSVDRSRGVTTFDGTTTYTYDANGRLSKIIPPGASDTAGYKMYTYDGRGNVVQTLKKARSGSALPDIAESANYDVVCTNQIVCNKPHWTKDANGNETDYTYDPTTGQVLTVTGPASPTGVHPVTTYGYALLQAFYKQSSGAIVASGLPISMLTSTSTCRTQATCVGSSDETRTTFDYGPQTAGVGNNLLLVGITVAAGDGSISSTTRYSYDAFGRKISVDGPLAGTDDTTYYRYDSVGRLVGVIEPDPDGAGPRPRRAKRVSYNDADQVVLTEIGTVTDASDAGWAAFSSAQQVVSAYSGTKKISDTLKVGSVVYGVTQFTYLGSFLDCVAVRMNSSLWSNLPASACTPQTQGTQGPDRITKTVYTSGDRVLQRQLGVGTGYASNDVTYAYDPATLLLNGVTDANGNMTSFTYDGFDRLWKTNYPSTTKGSGASSATDYDQLTYDANGNVTNKRLRDGGTIALGIDNLNRVTSRTENGSLSRQYGYNLFGQLTSSSWAGGSSPETMNYDALGRLTSRVEPYATLSYQYDAAGRRTRVTWPDGLYISYNYDPLNEMTTVLENGTTTLATYGYDDLGRRTSLTRGNGTATYYNYDGASRLTCLRFDLVGGGTLDCTPTASGQDNAITFGYNPAGQIASRTSANVAYAWTGNVNVNRSYTANGLNQYTASGSVPLGYDTRGNLNSSGSSAYGYDSLNHLIATNSAASALEYGSLDELQGYDLSSSYPRFASDGGNIIGEYLWGVSPNPQRRYVYGAGTDEPLVWYEGAGTTDKRWLVTDERGSVVAVTNASGAATNINTYDEYGIPAASNQGRFQYTGQAWLPEVGLYYYKARMYSPTLGRFMQTDPIGYSDGINWYNYAGGDPVNASDPTGSYVIYTTVCQQIDSLNGTGSRVGGRSDDIIVHGNGNTTTVCYLQAQSIGGDESTYQTRPTVSIPRPGATALNLPKKGDRISCEAAAGYKGKVLVGAFEVSGGLGVTYGKYFNDHSYGNFRSVSIGSPGSSGQVFVYNSMASLVGINITFSISAFAQFTMSADTSLNHVANGAGVGNGEGLSLSNTTLTDCFSTGK